MTIKLVELDLPTMQNELCYLELEIQNEIQITNKLGQPRQVQTTTYKVQTQI